jgi:fructose-1,6-bisphosphatase/inositol monophosphatase family enzyme
VDVDAVTALVEHVAATVVSPRFRALEQGDIGAKGVGDVVTVVDTEAESALTEGLERIAPGVPVVGEEGSAAEPKVLDALLSAPRAWVVDPLDGTQAFVEGSPDHAVMVALVEQGVPVAGWICLPAHGRTFVAEQGSGAWLDGRRLTRDGPMPDALDGGIAVWGMPTELREDMERRQRRLGLAGVAPQRLWSGYEYGRLATGDRDYLSYWRTSPWDHAPGAVVVRETGGVSRFLDGREYTALPMGGPLLVAADEQTWATVHAVVAGALLG